MSSSDKQKLVQVIVGAFATVLIGGAIGWAASTQKTVQRHETTIAVQAETQKSMKENVEEIKQSQRRVEDKLDRVLGRER